MVDEGSERHVACGNLFQKPFRWEVVSPAVNCIMFLKCCEDACLLHLCCFEWESPLPTDRHGNGMLTARGGGVSMFF